VDHQQDGTMATNLVIQTGPRYLYDRAFYPTSSPRRTDGSGGGISRGMRRAMNNQSLIGRFKETLAWVAVRSGKIYGEWDEDGSTRTFMSASTRCRAEFHPKCGSGPVRTAGHTIFGTKTRP
jgi:hypothetical protein